MKNRLDCAIHVLEHDAQGTCMSYHKVGSLIVQQVADVCSLKITHDEADELLGQAIEKTEIFLCDECGWWCEAHEHSYNDYDVCRDCNEEDPDE
ncbi:hypothetical protein OJNDCHOG_02035 [Klebsiella phage 150049]|uniref:Uncharacterized protein n=1 Tax=Klebsiella phage 150049 TaxID=2979597 RepID=A0A977PM28_9CAUD|nr:hypothetical protein OJNDCHOG_02035 [Klebsiella phage 150049]